jgi:hypothetical protein
VEQHPKTEYEQGFYKPGLEKSNSSLQKDYLQATGNIKVNFGGFDDE